MPLFLSEDAGLEIVSCEEDCWMLIARPIHSLRGIYRLIGDRSELMSLCTDF